MRWGDLDSKSIDFGSNFLRKPLIWRGHQISKPIFIVANKKKKEDISLTALGKVLTGQLRACNYQLLENYMNKLFIIGIDEILEKRFQFFLFLCVYNDEIFSM